MHKLLIGAFALSLLGGSAALADPMDHNQGDRGGDHQGQQVGDRHDGGGDRHDGGGDNRGGGDHHDRWDHRGHGHMVCSWRHHQRMCWRTHGW